MKMTIYMTLGLPGGKIEHGEGNIDSLKREIIEEIGLSDGDFKVDRILTAEEDFVQHIWNGEEKYEHIIAIIYVVNILNDGLNLNFIEEGGDSNGLMLMSLNDKETPKTNVLKKALDKFILYTKTQSSQ
ncbi:MAG: NUDIX domain-containing protein [Candidatus Gracilibacteria bacterium]|nr:NUDIX domain-containing protein [Candidatus Gracilibacteria bacterium]